MTGAWWTSPAGPPTARWAAVLMCLVATRVLTRVDGAIIAQGEAKFNQQWATGVWDYQDQVPAERLRNAAIGAVLLQKYCPGGDRCTVLEGGCGEGAVTDFLTPAQRLLYMGFDVSEHAVAVAVRKRGHAYGCRFERAHAHTFAGNASSVDAVVFSEMLYYTDHEAVIDRYVPFLRPHGIMVISLHMPTGKAAHAFDAIFTHAERRLQLVDVVEVGGRKHPPAPDMTHFRIKVFRLANSTSTSVGGSGTNSNSTTTV